MYCADSLYTPQCAGHMTQCVYDSHMVHTPPGGQRLWHWCVYSLGRIAGEGELTYCTIIPWYLTQISEWQRTKDIHTPRHLYTLKKNPTHTHTYKDIHTNMQIFFYSVTQDRKHIHNWQSSQQTPWGNDTATLKVFYYMDICRVAHTHTQTQTNTTDKISYHTHVDNNTAALL